MPQSLAQMVDLMQARGAARVYAKKLAPNDNSKNQIYLGGDFSALNIIPHQEVYTDDEEAAGSKRDRAKASVSFFWIDEAGRHSAPDAQLILYPKYPEVRMSGFLKGSKKAPSKIMSVRDPGRVLFLGICRNGDVLGFATDAESPITKELNAGEWEAQGVFLEIPFDLDVRHSSKEILLRELRRIYAKTWITSQKMRADGTIEPYSARNGGGYTLEAELGISPNGYSEPDFMGWEIKQYGVSDFTSFRAKTPVTLMTPEPNGGIYKYDGVSAFLEKFGYSDRSGKADRINFGGVYAYDKSFHELTGLRLGLDGFDIESGKITDMDGKLSLVSRTGEEAATWTFTGLMAHWNRKHAQAAYVPSIFQTPPPEYSYGPQILLCERTDFILFLKAVAKGVVYYDPAVKMENASGTSPLIKRRSQFRIRHSHLTQMYHQHETAHI